MRDGRLTIISLLTLAAFLVIEGRLLYLQVVAHRDYVAIAQAQHETKRTINPKRGRIFLRDVRTGALTLVATNVHHPYVYLVPREMPRRDIDAITTALSETLSLDPAVVTAAIGDGTSWYSVLKRRLTDDEVKKVAELKLAGVRIDDELWREYPQGTLAAHLVGFVGFSGDRRTGQYGIEEEYNDLLEGKQGFIQGARDNDGRWIPFGDFASLPAEDGADLVLTIDPAIQYFVERTLLDAVTKFGAPAGSAIVLDPKTGAILAMANVPTFDPNRYGETEDTDLFRNGAIQDLYEPGSVVKPLTMAAGIDTGAITPETTYESKGFVEVADRVIRNSDRKAYGTETMIQTLERSNNEGAVFAEQQIGKERFLTYLRRFGFGSLLGIDLPGEARIELGGDEAWNEVRLATAAFGQGLAATPLGVIAAFSALANDGTMMQPHIVAEVESDGGVIKSFEPRATQAVVTRETATTVRAMMVAVVENGHGRPARVPGYWVAGKTGTAQVPDGRGGYEPHKTIGSFVGFAPADDPAFVALVKIDDPQTQWAESSAAPTFGKIAQFLLSYLQVPPSR